ncbi:MAG: hypothetical protein NT105_01560 [Verrucomicrobia bacterium]|nr:hypothetical protein [Verrucomicrobiota bacterium]
MADNERGKRLAAWLNSLPEVQAVLKGEFGGRPIREQNISEWRKGGYREWHLRRDALDMVPMVVMEASELKLGVAGRLTDHMAVWLTAHLMAVVRRLAATDLDDAAKRKLLHEACGDVVALRRGDQNAEWLEIERERLAVAVHDVELKYKDVLEKYKKRTVIGLETLMRFIENKNNPKAKAAMNALWEAVATPLDKLHSESSRKEATPAGGTGDPAPSDPIRPDPAKSG